MKGVVFPLFIRKVSLSGVVNIHTKNRERLHVIS